MSMDAKAATNMVAISTVLGCVPALLRMRVARRLSILHFERAAASVNPPSRSMMTGLHIAAKMAFVASLAPRRLCLRPSSSQTTRSTTERNGTSRDVTNSGIVYVKSG